MGRPPIAERREQLLASSISSIRASAGRASMEDIATAAGITKPILYRHFGDRDGLLAAVAERFADELVARLASALEAGPSPEERIRAAIGAYIDFIQEDVELYDYLAQRTTVGGSVYRAVVDRVAATIGVTLSATLTDLGADTRPVETWAYGIAGMVHFAGAHWVRNGGRSKAELLDDLVALVWQGIPRTTGDVAPGLSPSSARRRSSR